LAARNYQSPMGEMEFRRTHQIAADERADSGIGGDGDAANFLGESIWTFSLSALVLFRQCRRVLPAEAEETN
jgi:hypothetical protein